VHLEPQVLVNAASRGFFPTHLTGRAKADKIGRMFRSLNFLFLFGMIAVRPVYAQESTPFQQDPVEFYAGRLLTALLFLGIGLVLYSIFRYRGRLTGWMSWASLALGVVIVPVTTISLGMLLVLEKAEQVEFCGSCHLTMKTYVDDLKNPTSHSLAAIHYQNKYIPTNQCYQCHTSYGMFGTIEAKSAGMIDVYKYYTRTFHLPIRMRTPYPNADCLKCHAESAKWKPLHKDIKASLFSGGTKCMECHGADNPAHTLSAARL